jgi:hypothetical protein
MMAMTTTRTPVRSRRPHRLGIDAHTEFVAVLVAELDAAVASLTAAAGTARVPAADGVDLFDSSGLERSVGDVRRLVRLLDTIDGPGDDRYVQAVSLPDAICEAAKGLDLDVAVRGSAGPERFPGDPEAVLLGAELVLSAFAGDGKPVQIGIPNDRVVHVEGELDFNDERRLWQLRCGRRVLEGENCRVRLMRVPGGYRLEIRALEP